MELQNVNIRLTSIAYVVGSQIHVVANSVGSNVTKIRSAHIKC